MPKRADIKSILAVLKLLTLAYVACLSIATPAYAASFNDATQGKTIEVVDTCADALATSPQASPTKVRECRYQWNEEYLLVVLLKDQNEKAHNYQLFFVRKEDADKKPLPLLVMPIESIGQDGNPYIDNAAPNVLKATHYYVDERGQSIFAISLEENGKKTESQYRLSDSGSVITYRKTPPK